MDGKTILIVDDEYDNRELIRTVAEEMIGCTAFLADNGEDALSLAFSHKPDLILLDLMIPGMDGFEVARRLKANPETTAIPIIAITALAQPEDRGRTFKAGCDDYIHKPFELDTLAGKIRKFVTC
jgi:CheY-like chemotaxis protein